MPKTIYFEGTTFYVPDDFSDAEIQGMLAQSSAPQAGAKPGDPRFFAPNSSSSGFFAPAQATASGAVNAFDAVGQSSVARRLGMSLGYAAQQDPDHYAYLLRLQDQSSIPPAISAGNEKQIQEWVDANSIDPHYFTTIAPVTAAWASDPDNASVAGVKEILRFGGIEQNATAMRWIQASARNPLPNFPAGTISAQPPVTPSWWNNLKSKTSNGINDAGNWIVDQIYDTFHPSAPVTPQHDEFSDEAAAATRERFNADNPTNSSTSLRYRSPAKPGTPQGPMPGPSLEDIANAELVREGHEPTIRDISSRDRLNPLEQQMYADQLRKIYAQVTLDVERGMHGDGWTPQAEFDTQPQGTWFTTKDPLVYESQLARLVAEAHPDFARWIGLPSAVGYRTLDVVNPDAAKHAEEILPLGAIFEHDKSKAGRFAQGVAEGLGSLTTPANVAMMVGTMGLGTTAKVGAAALDSQMLANFLEKAGPRWVSALFAAGMLPGDFEQGSVAYNQMKNGQYDDAWRTFGQLAVSGTLTLLAGAHALRGESTVGEAPDESGDDEDGGGSGPGPLARGAFVRNLSQVADAVSQSKLLERSPERARELLAGIFRDNESLQIPAQQFNDYFTGKSMDPAAVAGELGATNYADAAATPGGKVEVPIEGFLGELAPEHQQGLLPDVVDPESAGQQAEDQDGERVDANPVARIADSGGFAASVEQKIYDRLRTYHLPDRVIRPNATAMRDFVMAHAAEQGLTPEAFYERYEDTLFKRGAKKFDPAKFYDLALAKKIADDPAGAIREYNALQGAKGGSILSVDDARELSEFYRADKSRASNVQSAATKFIQDLYQERLRAPVREGHEPLVLSTAGGTGAGKSSFLDTPGGRALNSKADFVYDGTLGDKGKAVMNIQQALDANPNRNVAVFYIYRDPVEAFRNGVLKGAMEDGPRKGRTVPLDAHLQTHVNARKAVEGLREMYAADPRVKFYAVDNTHGKGNARVVGFDSLPAINEDGLRERLQNVLDEELRTGDISKVVAERSRDRSRPN